MKREEYKGTFEEIFLISLLDDNQEYPSLMLTSWILQDDRVLQNVLIRNGCIAHYFPFPFSQFSERYMGEPWITKSIFDYYSFGPSEVKSIVLQEILPDNIQYYSFEFKTMLLDGTDPSKDLDKKDILFSRT